MSDEKIILNKKKGNVKRLGMGLSALLGGLEDVDIFSSDALKTEGTPEVLKGYAVLPIEKIVPNKTQPRKVFLEDELLELSNSIAQNGVLQPLLVRKLADETFEIVAGERRFRASKLAGLKELPCVIRELSDAQVFVLAIIENIQRENLNPLEEAEGYLRLMTEFNHTQDEIAQAVGKSRSYIANLTRLTKLPQGVRELVMEGKLTSGHVRPLLSLKTEEQMLSVAEVILENNYNVRKVEELVNLILNDEEKLESLEENLAKIGKNMSYKAEISGLISQIILAFEEKFETPIKIKPSKKGGMISIKYKNEDELKKIMQNMVNISGHKVKNNVISIPGKEEFMNLNIN